MSDPTLPSPQRRTYDNGLTLLLQEMPHRASVSVGVWLRAGSRDEPAALGGITHFLEHMLFKGTERRNPYQISASLESVGGHLDAFTAREHVCYSGRALDEHLPVALDVLSDIVLHSTLPADEIEREKEVVVEEIQSYEDAPEDKVHDLLAEALWGDDPLGRPILGREGTVDSFTQAGLGAFYRERYHPANLIVSVAGSFDPAWLEGEVGRLFGDPRGPELRLARTAAAPLQGARYMGRDVSQLQLALGRPGLPMLAEDRYRMAVLNTIVGGGMSSRLFQSLREQRGLAYSIYSTTDAYRDAGMITLAMGVKPERGAEALATLRGELARFAAEGPTAEELASGKAQLRGGILLGEESVSNHMVHLALDEMAHGRYVPLQEHLANVEAVTGEEVLQLARRFFRPDGWTLAAVGPESDKIEREVLGAA